MALDLHHRQYPGEGHPLLVLHGLYGNQGNWAQHARRLAKHWQVHALDARNHGRSPWDEQMDYQVMAEDVQHYMASQGLAQAHVMGHSMGGKTAMGLALQWPERVSALVVVDMAPVAYQGGDETVIQGLQAIDLEALESRSQADRILAEYVASKGVRDFLLTNLLRSAEGAFSWRINLPVLAASFDNLKGDLPQQGRYDGPVLFIRGSESDYLLPEHEAVIMERFPRARIESVAEAGHWVHSEKPEAFLTLVEDFLTALD